jgi:hypothetical protein
MSYNNLAGNLDAQGQYAEAEPLFRQALAIRLNMLQCDKIWRSCRFSGQDPAQGGSTPHATWYDGR